MTIGRFEAALIAVPLAFGCAEGVNSPDVAARPETTQMRSADLSQPLLSGVSATIDRTCQGYRKDVINGLFGSPATDSNVLERNVYNVGDAAEAECMDAGEDCLLKGSIDTGLILENTNVDSFVIALSIRVGAETAIRCMLEHGYVVNPPSESTNSVPDNYPTVIN